MTKEDIKANRSLQVKYLEGDLSDQDMKAVEEFIELDDELEKDIDDLLLLGILSGKRLEIIVNEVESSKNEFLSSLLEETAPSPNRE